MKIMLCLALSAVCLSTSWQDKPALEQPRLEFAFEEIVTLAPNALIGATPWGQRNFIPITGGTFSGPRIKGKVLSGGWDFQLTTNNGCKSIHADYMIQTDDGVIVHVLNDGTRCPDAAGKLPDWATHPAFEAPNGRYGWLNGGMYIGTLESTTVLDKPAVRLRFYRVTVAP